jgi:hypothetical protein
MTLLALCNRVLSEVGFRQVTSVVGADPQQQQVLALANAEIRALVRQYDWPALEVEYTFNTVNGTPYYNMPADFRKLSIDSVFDEATYTKIRGGVNAEQWQKLKYGLLGSIANQRFRVSYDTAGSLYRLNLTPTPTAAHALVMFYYSLYGVAGNKGAVHGG